MADEKSPETQAPVGEQPIVEQPTAKPTTTLGKLKSKSDVKSFTKELSRLLGGNATVTVDMPVAEYNAFADSSTKLSQDREYDNVQASSAGTTSTTIVENGVTVTVRPSYV